MAFERLLVRSLLSVGSLSLSSASAGCPARFWHDSCPIGWGLSSPVRTWGKRGGDYCKITGREGGGGGDGGRARDSLDLFNVRSWRPLRLQGVDAKWTKVSQIWGWPQWPLALIFGSRVLIPVMELHCWPRAYKKCASAYICILIVFFLSD